jgi:hypothetical protein
VTSALAQIVREDKAPEVLTPENRLRALYVIERTFSVTRPQCPVVGAPEPAKPEPTTLPTPGLSGAVAGPGGEGVVVRSTCERGSQGKAVRELQSILAAKGYDVKADGVFGARTEAAVRKFQRDHGCKVDGVVGPETWGALLARAEGGPPQGERPASASPSGK